MAPLLASLHNYGIVAGAVLAALGAALRRGRLAVALPLALAAICAVSEYAVTPAINNVQPRTFGMHPESDAVENFSDLHQLSRALFGCVQLGALGLILLHARPIRPPRP